jgi:hypothetical protein
MGVKMKDYVNSIEKGIEKANNRDYENGMATNPVTVNLENSYLKIIRKCGSMDRPEILLFKVVPKNDCFVLYSDISKDIIEAIGIYGDITLTFEGNGPIKTAVIENI